MASPLPSLRTLLLAITVAIPGCVQGNVLFRGGTIATWNDASQAFDVFRNASLLVEGDEVSRIYNNTDQVPTSGVEVIDATDKIIVPGFVNTHQHVWQTLYKTLIPNLPFAAYFPRLGHMAPISSTLSVEEVRQSELMGALELMSEGTTTWVDITSVLSPETVEAALQATFESGGRSFFGATLQAREDFSLDQQISQIRDLASRPEVTNSSMVTLGLNYDGFDGSTAEDQGKVLDLINTGDMKFITTHYVGGPFGNTNSPELLHRPEWSLLNGTLPVIFSHSSHVTPLDASLLRQTNQHISIAPESEQHFGHGNPYSHLIMDQAALAADSVFGYSTSLVHQARMWLQAVHGRLQQLVVDEWGVNTNTPMTVNQAFYLATRAGALALRRPDLGIIAPGSKADLVFYDTTRANLLGWRDPIAAVMLHSNPGDISDVVVAGKYVKKDFKLVYEHWAELSKNFKESADVFEQRYRAWDFGELPHWFTLAEYKDAQEVDVVRGNSTGR